MTATQAHIHTLMEAGMTQTDIAHHSGLSEATIRRARRGGQMMMTSARKLLSVPHPADSAIALCKRMVTRLPRPIIARTVGISRRTLLDLTEGNHAPSTRTRRLLAAAYPALLELDRDHQEPMLSWGEVRSSVRQRHALGMPAEWIARDLHIPVERVRDAIAQPAPSRNRAWLRGVAA